MWFRKFLVLVVLSVGLFTNALMAEDNSSLELELVKYSQYAKTAGDVSNFIFTSSKSLKLDKNILNILLSSQIRIYQYLQETELEYAWSVKNGYRQPWELDNVRKSKAKVKQYLTEKRAFYTKDISIFELSDGFKKYAGASLDVIGIGLDVYNFYENIDQFLDGEGSVNLGEAYLNFYSLASGSVSLLEKIAPNGLIAPSKFGQFFSKKKWITRTNYGVMTLQLNSLVYSYLRDREINEIRDYSQREYKALWELRLNVYNQLLTAYTNDSNISRGEIGTILSQYPIFHPYNSGFLETIVLSDVFHKNIMNSTYIEDRFNVTNESDLDGFQRVVIALEALAHISVYEDDDFSRRLTKMIDAFPDDKWFTGLENTVAGAFSGEDAYKIFDITDLKKKLIPSELVRDTDIDAYTFYKSYYYNLFRGATASDWMEEVDEIGKMVSDFLEKDTTLPEEPQNPPTLLLTLPDGATIENNHIKANQGESISFYPDITAGLLRECINNAGENAIYTLRYNDITNQANKKSLSLNFDSSTQTFSFTMPSSEIALFDLYYGSGDTTQSCGVLSISENSSDADNSQSDLSDVEWVQQIKAQDYIDGNYNYGHRDIGRAIVTDSLGNIFVSGDTMGGLDSNNTFNGNEFIFLSKFNPNGEKLWINQYGRGGEHYEVHSMTIDSNDNLYISGWIGFGGMDARPLLYKFNKNGVLLWKNELPINYSFYEGQNKIALIEDEIIMSSSKYGNQSGSYARLTLRKFSKTTGELLWTKEIGEDDVTFSSHEEYMEWANNAEKGYDIEYLKLTVDENNKFYILALKRKHGDSQDKRYSIYEFDSSGNQLHEAVLDTNQSISLNNIKLYKNNFYLIGYERLNDNNYTNHLFKMHIDGETIWRTEFREQKYNVTSVRSLEIYNDTIYLTGSTNANKEVWLSKHTLNGTLLGSKSYLPLDDIMSGVEGEALALGLDDEIYIVGNGRDKASSDGFSSVVFKISNDKRSSEIGQNINLVGETQLNNPIAINLFTKEWNFSQDISNLTVSVLGNSYKNSVTENDFIKDGQTLKVNLTPNQSNFQNKLTLQFTDTNGNLVKVSGSDTFWSTTKTNHAPRLADGQIMQLVSGSGEVATLDITTYDSDGDSVTLSVENDAGGVVSIEGNRLSAAFSDGAVSHTIQIGLSDGKEKRVFSFTVLQFSLGTIESFYNDVDANSDYFYAIAFGTLKGVIIGEIDPNDSTQRRFRPNDSVSLAEALKMVVNAEYKAGLIQLTTADAYMSAYPEWAMKYYTFAREQSALDKEIFNLAEIYPTREVIAKLIVKTLHWDKKFDQITLADVNFTDADAFSDADMRRYGEIAHKAGLFMKGSSAKPQEPTTRAELATVIAKIFMIPHASLALTPQSVEQGEENPLAILLDTQAEMINTTHQLYDSSNSVTMALMNSSVSLTNPIDSEALAIGENTIYALIDNGGVKNLIVSSVEVTYQDSDSDGVQDRNDQWNEDARYCYDENGNGIPDILDLIYGLDDYNSSDTVIIDGQEVPIEQIMNDGGVPYSGGETEIMSINLSVDQMILYSLLEERNLSIQINHTEQENLDLTVDTIDASIATLTPSWNYEVLPWETYSDQNLTLTIQSQAYGESNISLKLTDEQNREYTKQIMLKVQEPTTTEIPLTRDGWNLIAICQDKDAQDIDLTGITEIQSQDGQSIYTGDWANYSNLEILEAGYAYWVKGSEGTTFDVGTAESSLEKPLTRDGWSLMGVCEDQESSIFDLMNGIDEIQSQDGLIRYFGGDSGLSSLHQLDRGYGYWVRGEKGIYFRVR